MKKLKIISISLLSGLILLSTTSLARTGTVNAQRGLVLREKASKSSNPITTVENNATVEILEESGDWYKVTYGDYEGYLYAQYVEAEEETNVQEEEPNTNEDSDTKTGNSSQTNAKLELNIYLVPSITSQIIGSVKQDEKIVINYEVGNWVNINYGNVQGWARKYFVYGESTVTTNQDDDDIKEQEDNKQDEEPTVDENKVSTILENGKGYVDVSVSVNVRKEASTSSEIIDTLLKNTEVQILGEEGDFYKIQYHDITGYISKSFISATSVK